ncbi:hypothetical protein VC83_07528 [Pseudogymnoascus destructans]|uniref:Beta-xylosidase C-terminal Concanavalin A-like domain-containing protein n=2 Tax=Pseudogymnoascus destructans TaxID=655981 RepID=L8G2B9_PSED2|nr:uncharacterized protein VC83_07528 [Pseudogymnoascus destructans]ELR07415.1 hypothetical protein GMDG_02550 [Pseudogymnoascus destructans 20631-21]OAF56170.1 hypothetical protein VC83_07528 [Pseudogymnoascus destructans]
MGRETVLFPVTWEADAWPVLSPVQGHISGWPLPKRTRDVRGSVAFVGDPDVVDFHPGSKIPAHFVHLTSPQEMSLIMRVQTDTRFVFSVDVVDFSPEKEGEEETGVTAFLTQTQHLDLGIVMLDTGKRDKRGKEELGLHMRLRVTNVPGSAVNFGGVETVVRPLPRGWEGAPIRLGVKAVNETHYEFFAASVRKPREVEVMGTAPATILSGGDGPFTGTLVGAYATSNGGAGKTESYVSRWRYQGKGQDIGNGETVPYTPFVVG